MEETIRVMKAESDTLKEGVLRFIASTDSPDRHGDKIDQGGWVFTSEVKFLWVHDRSIPPLGKVIRKTIEEGQLVLDVQFDLDDEFAAEIYRKYQEDFIDSVSVSFNPLEAEPRDMGDGIRFIRQELLELSAVPVPANPEATVKDGQGDVNAFFRAQLKWAQEVIQEAGAPRADGLKALCEDLGDALEAAESEDDKDKDETPTPEDKDSEDGEEFFTLEDSGGDEEQASFLESLQF